jgi:hypothetical protein
MIAIPPFNHFEVIGIVVVLIAVDVTLLTSHTTVPHAVHMIVSMAWVMIILLRLDGNTKTKKNKRNSAMSPNRIRTPRSSFPTGLTLKGDSCRSEGTIRWRTDLRIG